MIYKSIKLISGETLACGLDLTDDEFSSALLTETFVPVFKPVSFYSVKFNDDGEVSEVVGIQPWIPISKDEYQKLAVSAIIGLADLDDKAVAGYQDFWNVFEEREKELDLEDQEFLEASDEADIMETTTATMGKIYH